MISSSSERTHVHDVVKLLYNKFGQGVKQRTVSSGQCFSYFFSYFFALSLLYALNSV